MQKILSSVLVFYKELIYNNHCSAGCSAAGSALGSGPRGRKFESSHSDHVKSDVSVIEHLIFYLINTLRNSLIKNKRYLKRKTLLIFPEQSYNLTENIKFFYYYW